MASATFETVRRVRAKIGGGASERGELAREARGRCRAGGWRSAARGAGATALIAGGYVACIAGVRWLLALA